MNYKLSGLNKAIFIILLFLSISDLISTFIRPLNYVAFSLWLVTSIVFLSVCYRDIIYLIKETIAGRAILTVLAISLCTFYVIYNATVPENLSGETTQEIACILKHINYSNNFGFDKTCFFGYPARQFYIPAIPSLIAGKSVITLQLGGALWFLVTLPIFAAGLLSFFKGKFYADHLCAFHILLLFNFRYFNHFLFQYEQSIFPFCFTLAACGLVLKYYTDNDFKNLLFLTIVAVFAIFAYTPGLSLVAIIIVFLIWLFFKLKDKRILLLLLVIVLELVTSFLLRQDLKIAGSEKTISVLSTEVLAGLVNIVAKNNGAGLASDPVTYYTLLLLFLGLVGVFKVQGLLLSSWFISCILAALIARGYTYYAVDFRLHRANVAIPAILLLSCMFITKIISEKVRFLNLYKTCLLIILIITGWSGYTYSQRVSHRQPNYYVPVIFKLNQRYDKLKLHKLLTTKPAVTYLGSMRDYMQYFAEAEDTAWVEDCNKFHKELSVQKKILYISLKNEAEDVCGNLLTDISSFYISVGKTDFRVTEYN